MRIVIAGSSGFIGTALVARFRAAGHDVSRLVRRTPESPHDVRWSPAGGELDPAALAGADVAINLAGVGIGDKRWTAEYKREIQNSRIDATVTLSRALATVTDGPTVLLNASAIGFYGDRGDEMLDETSPAGDGFLPDVCRAWESATQAAEDAGLRVAHLRTGLVLGAGAGLMGRVVPLYKAGIGGKLGSGRQFMSWITLVDEVRAIEYAMDHDAIAGAVNLTGPAPVRNEEFTHALGRALHRPTILPTPGFAIRAALGEFATDVLSSARVIPAALTGAGFIHEHPDITSALTWVLASPQGTPDTFAG